MDLPSTDTLLLLDRPSHYAPGRRGGSGYGSDGRPGRSDAAVVERSAGGAAATSGGIGLLPRAPGLALLAVFFLVEGYRWLGIVHIGTTVLASLLFGSVGQVLVALSAPVAAVVLTSGRRAPGWVVVEDAVIVAAVTVTVVTGTASVVGGSAWRDAAGIADLVLAATALGVVFLGERAHRRSAVARPESAGTNR